MEQHELDARLATLAARRPATPAAAAQGARPAAGSGRRRHAAHRSRVAVTVMSLGAMVGITGYMAASDASSNAAAISVDGAASATATNQSSTNQSSNNQSSTNAVSLGLTSATPASGATAAAVATTSKGS